MNLKKSKHKLSLRYSGNFLLIILFVFKLQPALAFKNTSDTTPFSTQQQAILFINNIKQLKQSIYWPNVRPDYFLRNLKENINFPLSIYEGSNTNFCGYAALSYLPLHDDPLGYVKFMVQLYKAGKAMMGKANILPSDPIYKAAGTLKFKGILDIRPADQMWFLSLADHFKGYVNFLNNKFNPGDENTFWASVNYAKFNRMVKKLFNYKIDAKGFDLMHPHIKDLYNFIEEKLKRGTIILYINNAYLYKKKHNMLRPGIPTHYVVLLNITNVNGLITMTYWDYGFRSVRQITSQFLKKILFGVTLCTKKLS